MFAFFNRNKGVVYLLVLTFLLPILVISYGFTKNILFAKYQKSDKERPAEIYIDSDIGQRQEIAQSIGDERQVMTTGETMLQKTCTYSLCSHTEEIDEPIRYDDIGLNRAEFTSRYPDWYVSQFSKDTIIMKKQLDGYCPEHYILQDLNGVIAIYKPSIDSKLDIIKETDIPTEYLSQELQLQIKTGLAVESLEEVEYMIENMDS